MTNILSGFGGNDYLDSIQYILTYKSSELVSKIIQMKQVSAT